MGTRRDNNDSWVGETPNAQGYYEAFVSMGTKPNGKPDRRHVKRKTLKAVRARVKELEADRDAGHTSKPGKIPTVRQMLERHLTTILPSRGRAPRTIDDYWSKCRNDIFPRWGGQRADRLLPEWVEDGLAEMLTEGRAPSHVRKVYAILSSAYQVQVDRGNLARNPCEHVEPPELTEPEMVSLTAEEALAVLAAAKQRPNANRWVVGLTHGLRQGEALGMRWDYLNLDTGELRVWHQIQRLTWRHGCADAEARRMAKAGRARDEIDACRTKAEHDCGTRHHKIKPCGPRCRQHARACPPVCEPDCTGHARKCPQRRDGGLVFREIKERRRKRVWLDPAFCVLLREHRDAQFLQRTEADHEWAENDLVFCQWNGKPVDPRRDWADWGEILKAAGLPPRRLHALRHAAATLAIGEGVAVPVVKEMLGHSDIRVTQRYIHVAEAQMKAASGRMAQAFLTPPQPKIIPGNATKTATTGDEK
jgi:integrase